MQEDNIKMVALQAHTAGVERRRQIGRVNILAQDLLIGLIEPQANLGTDGRVWPALQGFAEQTL
ncbi:MAG: hypothetical protein Rhims3KO_09750 [Hyphomicrobiales bacterium]